MSWRRSGATRSKSDAFTSREPGQGLRGHAFGVGLVGLQEPAVCVVGDSNTKQNVAKHGVPFDHAARVFRDPDRIDREDDRHNYNEERRITLGRIDGRLFVVSYTVRDNTIRLISARKANERDKGGTDETLSTDPEEAPATEPHRGEAVRRGTT